MSHLLSPEELEKLKEINFTLPRLYERGMSGRHRTTQQGTSVEFSQHRDYAPGDPIKHLDWKAYARSERFVIKEFESESNVQIILVLDRSKSMSFRGGSIHSKLAFACRLAHAFSWLLLRKSDAVGLLSFADDNPEYVPPSSKASQLEIIEAALQKTRAQGGTRLEVVADFISNRCHRNAICIFLTDFLDESAHEAEHLIHLKRKRVATYCIHLLSRHELELTQGDRAIYVDEESNENLLSEPDAIREAYRTSIDQWLATLRAECQHHGIPYLFSSTELCPIEAVRQLSGQTHR